MVSFYLNNNDNLNQHNNKEVVKFEYIQTGFVYSNIKVEKDVVSLGIQYKDQVILSQQEQERLFNLIQEFIACPRRSLPKQEWPQWLIKAEETGDYCCDLPMGNIEIVLSDGQNARFDINKTEYNKDKLNKIIDYLLQIYHSRS